MKQQLAALISAALQHDLSLTEVTALLEKPKYEHLGDLAFPCFTLAKKYKKSPAMIASEVAQHIQADFIKEVKVEGAYINFYLQ